MHTNEIVNEKSKIVLHYNATKGGTDTFDKLCHSYSVTKRTNRWPVRYFYGILDMAIVNARILMKCMLKNNGIEKKVTAISCLDELYLHLVTPYLERRYETITLRKDIRIGIAAILKKDNLPDKPIKRIELLSQQRCALCSRQNDKKTKKGCSVCYRPVCAHHGLPICTECCGI